MNLFNVLTRLISVSLWFLLLVTGEVIGQSQTQDKAENHQVAEIEIRPIDESRLDNFRNDDTYDYSIQRGQGTTWWERFKNWLGNFIRSIFFNESSASFFQVLIYLLISAAIVFSILKFIGADVSGFLKKGKKAVIPYHVADENIHEIDFDAQIQNAVDNHDYRMATRLYYLQALKVLSDRNVLHWKTGKTNSDYFYELKAEGLRTNFSNLGHLFEYAWYGGFAIEKSSLDYAKNLFDSIKEEGTSEAPGTLGASSSKNQSNGNA